MTKQLLVIHGGDAYDRYEDYIASLKQAELSLARLQKKDWKSNLHQTLGQEYDVILPRMPNAQNARYAEWKIWFEKIIPLLDETVVLIGHSLGGVFLAKYLSENKYPKKIKATFLVAAPYNTVTYDPFVDFNLGDSLALFAEQGGTIFLYHSSDDVVVPYHAVERYAQQLPDAIRRVFDDRGHFNAESLPELVEDIRTV
jgi:uncharacterized protein